MKKLLSLVLVMIMMLSLAACGGTTTDTAATTTAAATTAAEVTAAAETIAEAKGLPEDFHIAYAAVTTSLAPWVIALAKNFEDMCKAKGWDYSIYDGMGDVTTQTEQISSIISDAEADLVILFPADSEVGVTYVEQLTAANIPVITLGSDVKEAGQANVKCYVGPNNREIVGLMADYVIKKLGTTEEQNVVCISGWQAQYDYIVREDEMKTKLATAPNYKILATEYAGASRADAKTIMEKYLTAYPDIDVVFCMSDEFALGAIVALEAANKLDKVTVVSLEAFQEGIDAVKAGKMDITVTMTAANVISKLSEVIEPVMLGEKLDYLQYCKVEAITKDNAANFKGEY